MIAVDLAVDVGQQQLRQRGHAGVCALPSWAAGVDAEVRVHADRSPSRRASGPRAGSRRAPPGRPSPGTRCSWRRARGSRTASRARRPPSARRGRRLRETRRRPRARRRGRAGASRRVVPRAWPRRPARSRAAAWAGTATGCTVASANQANLPLRANATPPATAAGRADVEPAQEPVGADPGDQLEQDALVELPVGERGQQRGGKSAAACGLAEQGHPGALDTGSTRAAGGAGDRERRGGRSPAR